MATKSKVKKGSSKKKSSKKKTRKPKIKAGLTLGIGVISTIRVPQLLRQAFRRGLNNPNVFFRVEPVRSYKKPKLKLIIEDFNDDDRIGLIITVGGLVAYQAANLLADKPFISLVGVVPTNSGPNCFGGVTLRSFQSNPLRIAHLESMGYEKAQIGLLQNPNSAMAAAEAAAWTGANPAMPGGDNAGENDASKYADNFDAIPDDITAVVISGDPFFQETKDELVAAANNSDKYICYPFQDYADASPPPTTGKATLYGPLLKEPYALLGERAAKVLGTAAKLEPLFVAVDDTIDDL